jgi:hypothetical protein
MFDGTTTMCFKCTNTEGCPLSNHDLQSAEYYLGRFNKGSCEGQENKKKNMKCTKLRQCVFFCTIIQPGQKDYGQVLEIRL